MTHPKNSILLVCKTPSNSAPDNFQRQGVSKEFWGVNRCVSPPLLKFTIYFAGPGGQPSQVFDLRPSLIWNTEVDHSSFGGCGLPKHLIRDTPLFWFLSVSTYDKFCFCHIMSSVVAQRSVCSFLCCREIFKLLAGRLFHQVFNPRQAYLQKVWLMKKGLEWEDKLPQWKTKLILID